MLLTILIIFSVLALLSGVVTLTAQNDRTKYVSAWLVVLFTLIVLMIITAAVATAPDTVYN